MNGWKFTWCLVWGEVTDNTITQIRQSVPYGVRCIAWSKMVGANSWQAAGMMVGQEIQGEQNGQ